MFGLIILVQSKTNINENCADVSPMGYSHSRCIGCTPAKLGQYPWQVALVRRYIGGIIWNFYFCGGILISTGLVLTAAHCLHFFVKDFSQLTVILGHIDKENESQQTIAKGMIKNHFLNVSDNIFPIKFQDHLYILDMMTIQTLQWMILAFWN